MKDKLLYSVLGGCIGAILTSIFSLFSPLSAQDIPFDMTFGKITCKELHVQNPMGTTNINGSAINIRSLVLTSGVNRPECAPGPDHRALGGVTQILGGYISVSPNEPVNGMVSQAAMFVDKNGGRVVAMGNALGLSRVEMGIGTRGGRINVVGQDVESQASIYIDEYGGNFDVYGSQ